MEKFRELKLSENLLKAIEEAKFETPSEIQEKTIPLVLQGKDVLGSSSTGSGKTLAFGAGIIDNVKRGAGIQALILTPTRELAEQVAQSLRNFSRHHSLRVKEVYGGVAIGPQIDALARAEIVVGTPGRILDHLDRRTLNLEKVKYLVLDEADRMLEMGFIKDVENIIKMCPEERQTLLFSATMSQDIQRISRKYMKAPVLVEVESYVDPSKLKQVYYDVPQDKKFSLLVHLLKQERKGLVMVFCNTRRNTDMVVRNLMRYEIHSMAIHGGLTQNKRNDIIKSFHSQEVLTLVCTDVAARGLDIKGISHVYNYDIPKNSTEYVHRIGRTARAGKEGIAVNLVSPRDYENFRSVKQDSSLNIQNVELPELETLDVNFKMFNNDRGSRGGNRRFGGGRDGQRDGRRGDRGAGRSFGGRERSFSDRREGSGRSFGGGRPSGRSFGSRSRDGEGSSGSSGGRPPGRSFGNRSGGRSFGGRPSGGRSFGGGRPSGRSFGSRSRDGEGSGSRDRGDRGRSSGRDRYGRVKRY